MADYSKMSDEELLQIVGSKKPDYSKMSDAELMAVVQKAQAAATEPSTLGDVARSFGRGVAKGAIGVAGLPGDVGRLVGRGVHAAGSAVGLPEPPPEAMDLPLIPSSEQVQRGVEKATGKFGEPATEAGRWAQSIGEFVPGSILAPGGTGMLSKLGVKAGSALAGGAGAQGGEEVAEALDLDPQTGRFVGGLGGTLAGNVASVEGTAARLRGTLRKEAGEEAARASAKTAYDEIKQNRVKIVPAALDQFVADAKTALDDELFVEASSPRTFRGLDKLQSAGGDISNLMATYERLGKITAEAGDDYAAATIVRAQIGDFLDNLAPGQAIGDPKYTTAMWEQARAEWRASKKLEEIRRAKELAQYRAARTGTGANLENAMRQEIGKIFDSTERSRGYTPEQKEQLKNIVVGDWLRNKARYAGKFAPSGPVSAAGSVLTGLEAGAPLGVAFGLSTYTMKHLAEFLTKRQIAQLEEMLMRASPLGKGAGVPQAPEMRLVVPGSAAQTYLGAGAGSPLTADQQ